MLNEDVEQLGDSEPCAFSPRNHPSIEARQNAITSLAPFAAHRPPCPRSWAPHSLTDPLCSFCVALWFLFGLHRADVTGANHRGFGPCASDFSISTLALALSPCYLGGRSRPVSSRLDPGPIPCPLPPTCLPSHLHRLLLNPWT